MQHVKLCSTTTVQCMLLDDQSCCSGTTACKFSEVTYLQYNHLDDIASVLVVAVLPVATGAAMQHNDCNV
eukprot:15983-Heterococcus_DN1.PRE.2